MGISNDGDPTLGAYTLSFGPSLSYPVPLLSDFWPHGEVTKLYGVFNEETGVARRTVLVIDKEGVIRYKQSYANISEFDVEDVLAEVNKLQG